MPINAKGPTARPGRDPPCGDAAPPPQVNAASLQVFDDLPNAAHVRLPVVAALFSVSAATVWRWCKAGHLPRPTRIGGVALWNVGTLRAFLASPAVEDPSGNQRVRAPSHADPTDSDRGPPATRPGLKRPTP